MIEHPTPLPHTDMPRQHIIYKLLPQNLKVYIQLLRLDRPVGVAFLFIPCLWGMVLSGSFDYIFYFLVGSILMRSAGCIYNDIVDRDIDNQVERTQLRPLACGAITVGSAIAIMLAIMAFSGIILLQFNPLTIGLGLFSILLVACYPWMKRITFWPQLFLGFTFNWGSLMAYTAYTGQINVPIIFIYIYGILWTIFYDTIYAHQDKEDDAIVGVKSSALKLGSKTKPFLLLTVITQTVILIMLDIYIVGLISFAVSIYILLNANINDPVSCLKGFKQSQIIGWITLIGLIFKQFG